MIFNIVSEFDILEGLIDLQVYWVIKPEVDRSSLFAVGSGFGPLAVLLSQMAVSNANCKNACAGGDTCQEPMSGCIAPSFTCYTARISINNRNSQTSTRGTVNAHRTLKVSTDDTVKSQAILNTLVIIFWSVYSILCNWTSSHCNCSSYPTSLLFILLPLQYTSCCYLLSIFVHHFTHTHTDTHAHTHTPTPTHLPTHIHIYIYICVCVCVFFVFW